MAGRCPGRGGPAELGPAQQHRHGAGPGHAEHRPGAARAGLLCLRLQGTDAQPPMPCSHRSCQQPCDVLLQAGFYTGSMDVMELEGPPGLCRWLARLLQDRRRTRHWTGLPATSRPPPQLPPQPNRPVRPLAAPASAHWAPRPHPPLPLQQRPLAGTPSAPPLAYWPPPGGPGCSKSPQPPHPQDVQSLQLVCSPVLQRYTRRAQRCARSRGEGSCSPVKMMPTSLLEDFPDDVGGLQVRKTQWRILEVRPPVQQALGRLEHLLAAARGRNPSPAEHPLCLPARVPCPGWVAQAR